MIQENAFVDIAPDDPENVYKSCLSRFVQAGDENFHSWLAELSIHPELTETVQKLQKSSERIFGEAPSLSTLDRAQVLQKIESEWVPFVEEIRSLVAKQMSAHGFKSRPCWIQLRDRATYMIMVLEEALGESKTAVAQTSKGVAKSAAANFEEIISDADTTPEEEDRYDAFHLSAKAYLSLDKKEEDTQLVDKIRKMLSATGKEQTQKPYRRMNQRGYVCLEKFREISDTFGSLVKIFEAGLSKYGKSGLPKLFYPSSDRPGAMEIRRILYKRLLRNLKVMELLLAGISHDVKKKDAIGLFFQPTYEYLREIRIVSEHCFRAEAQPSEAPELTASRKLLPACVASLKTLSAQIAEAEKQTSETLP